MSDDRIYKKYGDIRVFQKRENRPKLVFKPHKPIHLNFNIDYDPKLIETLNQKLGIEKAETDPNRPPLFHMRSQNDPNTNYHNMQLTRIVVKCQSCDFEQRLSKQHIDKYMRQHKRLNLERSKLHTDETGHRLLVENRFEQWKPRLKI